jgi:hypothetical protein
MMLRRKFLHERTWSSPLDPMLMFGAFWTVLLCQELRCKIGWTGVINAQVCGTKSCWNFSWRTHPIYHIGPQTNVLVRFEPFRYYTNFSAKRVELALLIHKFVQWNCVRIFCNERTRSTTLDHKLMFWHVSEHFVSTWLSVFNRLPTEGYTQGGKFWVRERRDQELEGAKNTRL